MALARTTLRRLARGARGGRWLSIVVVLLVSVVLRVWGIDFGLPYTYHPDEPAIVNRAVEMFRSGDLNPHWFHYPTLYTYLVAAAYSGLYLLGLWGRGWVAPGDMPAPQGLVMGGGMAEVPEQFLVARLVTMGLGILTVALAYRVARQLWGREPGSLAALFVAVSSLHVGNAQFATTDVPMAFFVTLSLAFCVRVVRRGGWQDYALAGLAAGLAVSTKYNAGPILASLVVAHGLRAYPRLVDWRLLLGLGASVLGFALGTPYAFLDVQTFWSDLVFELRHYATGHHGSAGERTWWWIVRVLVRQEALLLPLGVLGAAAGGLRRSDRGTLPLSVFILLYYALLARQTVRFSRNLVVLMPALAVLGAGLVSLLARWLHGKRWAVPLRMGLTVVIAGSLVIPVARVVRRDRLLAQQDVRTTAGEWVTAHIDPESRIAGESYAPSLDPEVYDVEYLLRGAAHDPAWYREQGFEYLMLSSWMYGRYYREPERYAEQVARYDSLFRAFSTAASFEGPMMGYPGAEILVLKVR